MQRDDQVSRPDEARRIYLETGSYQETGRRMGITRQAARQLVARSTPLEVGISYRGDIDRDTLEAIGRHVRRILERVNIRRQS